MLQIDEVRLNSSECRRAVKMWFQYAQLGTQKLEFFLSLGRVYDIVCYALLVSCKHLSTFEAVFKKLTILLAEGYHG